MRVSAANSDPESTEDPTSILLGRDSGCLVFVPDSVRLEDVNSGTLKKLPGETVLSSEPLESVEVGIAQPLFVAFRAKTYGHSNGADCTAE